MDAPLPTKPFVSRSTPLGAWGEVCRLGLATRGNAGLTAGDYEAALDHGINYFNWCGYPDGLSAAVRRLSARRHEFCLAVQLEARSSLAAAAELRRFCGELGTSYLDVVTYYYVEERAEWDEIAAVGGARGALRAAQAAGQVRRIGLTSHQRPLAAQIAASGQIDLLMIRYNTAHRGAEQQIFPVTKPLHIPVVAYTALRWQALLQPTPEDPAGFCLPTAAECYQFVLAHPDVTVVLAAPNSSAELQADLALLEPGRELSLARYRELQAHGDRVRRHAGSFP